MFLLKPLEPDVDVLAGDEVLVVAETSLESVWDMEEFVDEDSVLTVAAEGVELLGDDLDYVCGLDAHRELPDPPEAMDAGNGPPRLASPAPDAINVTRLDMVKPEEIDDLVYSLLDVYGGVVIDQAWAVFCCVSRLFNISGSLITPWMSEGARTAKMTVLVTVWIMGGHG